MAKSSDLSAIEVSVCDKPADINVTDDDIKSITNKIICVLQLDDDEIKDQIVNDLLESGRQSLVKHQENIIADIYAQMMDSTDSELIILLKKYFQQQWETQYGKSKEWFILFLKEYQKGDNHELYERILIRTAEYGNIYMKDCPILSIVLQLLFESIDDQCLKETNIFDDLWLTVTTDGLKGITKYSDYIVPDVMNEQLKKIQPTLFEALRIYYRGECGRCGKCEKLFCLLERNKIKDRNKLYESALDNVAEHGWLSGVKEINTKITPKSHAVLLQNLNLFLQQRKVAESTASHVKNNNTASINIQLEATSNETTIMASNEKQGNHILNSI